MAQITDIGCGTLTTGIVMPLLKSRWRIKAVADLSGDDLRLLVMQSISFKFKFAAASKFGFDLPHTAKWTLEEPICGNMGEVVQYLATLVDGFDIVIEHLGGDATVLKTSTYKGVTVQSYETDLDYAASATSKFPLELLINKVEYTYPE